MVPSAPPKSVQNLVDLLRWRAEVARPEEGFVFLENGEGDGTPLTFAALNKRAQAIGARIAEVTKPGDRALLLYPPSLDYIEAFFGCLYAGVIAVPAYPPNPRRLQRTLPRLLSIVEDAGATVALTTEMIASMAQMMGTEAPGLNALNWMATDSIEDSAAGDWQEIRPDPKDIAFLQYTSGSTGQPKGVILDHETLILNEVLIQGAFGSGADDVGVNWLPLYHDMGLIGAVIQPVYCGCDSVLMSPLDFLKKPQRWVEAISRFGGTASTAPNFGYDLAVKKTPPHVRDSLDLSTWTAACNGAEPVRPATLKRFAAYFEPCGFNKKAFMAAYGLAEVGLIVSGTNLVEEPRVVDGEDKHLVTCGTPLGDFEVLIVDPESREIKEEGATGEIWLQKGSVARGYWQKEEVNNEVFQARLPDGSGPYLRTGDLGFVVDGELVVTGRLKDLIVIRGANHYPQDIEATVEQVDEAIRRGCGAAFAVETGEDEEGLVVVQEIDEESVEDLGTLLQQVSAAIVDAHQIQPREVVFIKARTIEKTSSGKIQRFASRKAYLEDDLEVVARSSELPREKATAAKKSAASGEKSKSQREIETWLVARVAEETGLSRRDVLLDRPFSAFGVDSAGAVGIVGELEEWLEVEVSATALYDFPTIEALAGHLSGAPENKEGADKKSGDAPLPARERPSEERSLAIVGMACRFPGAPDVESFWRLLMSGKDAFLEVPEDRWEAGTFTDPEIAGFDTIASDRGGFLEDIAEFDAEFFEISAGEARAMDPQQRLVLETAWQALEDAGLSREALSGSRTGVFIGQSGSDFARLYQGPPVRAGTGMAPSISANRLSYWLNLRGPSMVLDTACSSSLVALDQALMNLRSGRCDAAIVGGVNVILAPDMSQAFSQARMLSKKGQLRAFDAGADGYVRGEGCAMLVVKPLSEARRAGDRIHAVIRGGAVNQDGQTNGLTAPSGEAQKEVIYAALADAGLGREEIDAIEAHGTGTELGDAIEVRALRGVFEGQEGIWLGTVKSQIGHLEAGAGAAGLLKAALMVKHKVVPPQVNFETPNPECRLEKSPFRIATEKQEFAARKTSCRVGINSFGFGGTNAHFIVEAAPEQQAPQKKNKEARAGVIGISAESVERLRALGTSLLQTEHLWDEKTSSVRDLGYSLGHRSRRPVRLAFAADSLEEARRVLKERLEKIEEPADRASKVQVMLGEEQGSAEATAFCAGLVEALEAAGHDVGSAADEAVDEGADEAVRLGADRSLRELMDLAATLWEKGLDFSLSAVNQEGQWVEIPTTPYLRKRFWPREGDLRKIKAGEGQ